MPVENIPQGGFLPTADMVNHPNPAIRASQVVNLANLLRSFSFLLDQIIEAGEEGVGTVSSVGFTAPGEITVAGSPITTSGTIQTSWTSQLASLVLASPSGGPGTPSFRQLLHSELGGVSANQHHNEDHRARHISAGADAFLSTDFLEAIVKRLRESSGPTDMALGAVADGTFLRRSGTDIIGSRIGLVPYFQLAYQNGLAGTATTTPTDIPIQANDFSFYDAYPPVGATAEMIVYAGDTSGVGDVTVDCYDYTSGVVRATIPVGAGGGGFLGPVAFTFPAAGTNSHQVRFRWYRAAGSGSVMFQNALVYVVA